MLHLGDCEIGEQCLEIGIQQCIHGGGSTAHASLGLKIKASPFFEFWNMILVPGTWYKAWVGSTVHVGGLDGITAPYFGSLADMGWKLVCFRP